METRALVWTLVLCLGLTAWLYLDLKQSLVINYDWHSYLINSTTGQKMKPRDVYDLGKVINVTEDYVNSTNAIERLHDLEYNLNIENPISNDQVYSNALHLVQSGWPVANQSRCGTDLKWISEQLARHPDYPLARGRLGYELTQLMDSFGKPESGLYSGLVTWVGSYKQCQKVSLNRGQIKTRYCFARMRPRWWPKNETVHPRTRIRVGICIPETCDTMSFKRQKQTIEALIKHDFNQFYRDNLELDSMFCLPDERSPIRQIPLGGRIFTYVVGAWLSLVVLASIVYEIIRRRLRKQARESMIIKFKQEFWEKGLTVSGFLGRGVYDPAERAKSKESSHQTVATSLNAVNNTLSFQLLESLSIHRSLKDFKSNTFAEQQQQQEAMRPNRDHAKARVNLCCLSSIKFLMAILVVMAHSAFLNSVYTRSLGNRIDLNVHHSGKMVMSVAKCVDTFFIIFGILTSYTLLRKFTVKQLSSPLIWIGVNAGILLRIGPVFMLIYWYSKLISPYMGDGPWWDYGVYRYSMKGNCMNEPWWKSIPYFGCSGSPAVATCVLPAWFLISYSQLSLIMPLMTYVLYKLPNHLSRWLLLTFATIISCSQLAMKMYQQTSIREEAFTLYGGFLANLVEKFESTGTMSTVGRVGCVSVGCYVGYLLRMYELERIRAWPKWFQSKVTIIAATLLHLVVILLPLIGHLVTRDGQHMVSLDEFVGSYVMTLVVWPILNAVLIINAVTVYNRIALIRFFSHSFWHSANKLGLCIYLVHWEVLFIGVTSYEHAPSMGFKGDIVKLWSFGVFFSILLALFIHVLIEAPVAALMMQLARHFQKKLFHNSPEIAGSDDEKRLDHHIDPSDTPKLSIR